MTPDERRALLGADVVTYVRAEARQAAEEYPPSADVIDALRPILTSQRTKSVRTARKSVPQSTPAPLAA